MRAHAGLVKSVYTKFLILIVFHVKGHQTPTSFELAFGIICTRLSAHNFMLHYLVVSVLEQMPLSALGSSPKRVSAGGIFL